MADIPFPLAGEAAAIGAAMIWAISLTIFTWQGAGLPAHTLNFFKTTLATLTLGAFVIATGTASITDTTSILMLAASGFVGLTLGDSALFAALKRLGAHATATSQTLAPPLAALIALFFWGELLTFKEGLGVLLTTVAVAAVIVMRSPPKHQRDEQRDSGEYTMGVIYALASAACQALGLVLARFALQNLDIAWGTFIRLASGSAFLLFYHALVGDARASLPALFHDRKRLTWIIVASFLGTCLGLVLMSASAKFAKAGVAAALTSTYPIWIIPLAFLLLREKIRFSSILATIVAIVGIGILVL